MKEGVLLVDKPQGWTSFDVVKKIRSTLGEYYDNNPEICGCSLCKEELKRAANGTDSVPRASTGDDGTAEMHKSSRSKPAMPVGRRRRHRVRVGHAGTLDPMATGLLILLIGKSATKQAQDLLKLDKSYQATITLGLDSTTDDTEGELTKVSEAKPSDQKVQEVVNSFIGKSMQVPPDFSAIKVKGKRAYNMARKGQKVKLKPRPIEVYEVNDLSYSYPKISFLVTVSSGTYIRSLARDIGKELGVGGYLSSLRRLTIDEFTVDEAINPVNIDQVRIEKNLMPVSVVTSD